MTGLWKVAIVAVVATVMGGYLVGQAVTGSAVPDIGEPVVLVDRPGEAATGDPSEPGSGRDPGGPRDPQPDRPGGDDRPGQGGTRGGADDGRVDDDRDDDDDDPDLPDDDDVYPDLETVTNGPGSDDGGDRR